MLAWVGEHLPFVQATAAGQRPIYWILWMVLVVGLIAQIGAYLLRTTATGEPLGVIADLLHALGYSLAAFALAVPGTDQGTRERRGASATGSGACHTASRLF